MKSVLFLVLSFLYLTSFVCMAVSLYQVVYVTEAPASSHLSSKRSLAFCSDPGQMHYTFSHQVSSYKKSQTMLSWQDQVPFLFNGTTTLCLNITVPLSGTYFFLSINNDPSFPSS